MNSIFFLALAVMAPPEVPHGHLVVAGGGTTSGAISKKALELAGGSSARVLVVPQASAAANAGESSAAMWRGLGAKKVTVLKLDDAQKAVELVNSADLIWMPGGDQNRLMKALAGTKVPEAMRERYRAGATLGGTSAGAAVMSKVMITGEAELTAVKGKATQTAEGLDLWPGVIVDQHFVRRQRFNRLLSAVIDHPDLVGIGIDEATAAVVSRGQLEVVGAGQVLIIDARGAKVTAPAGQLSVGNDLRLHVLTPGMKFALRPPAK